MLHVFVSYAHADGDFVQLVKIELEKAGFDVWLDVERLRAGEDWRQGIDEAIKSALALVLVLTPEAFESTYVTYEWAYALGLGIKVIPLLLRPTRSHPRLEFLQYLDFTHRVVRPWAKLIEDLQQAVGERSRVQQASALDNLRLPKTQAVSAEESGGDSQVDGIRQYLNALREGDLDAAKPLVEMGADALPTLLKALLENDHEIHGAVAYVFEQMDNDGILFLLEALHEHQPLARLAAIRGLGILEITDAVPGILKALRDEDGSVRVAATQALQQIGRAAIPELLNALTDLHVETRVDAAWALGELKDERAVEGLLKALHDADSDVRITVADALGEIGGATAVEGLLQILNDGNDRVRYAAVLALGRIGDCSAVDDLLKILSSNDSDLRHLTTAVLGDIGHPAAVPCLLSMLQNEKEEEQVRITAAAALGEIGDPVAIQVLLEALHHVSDNISSAAALALGKIGDTRALNPLIGVLDYDAPDRRCAAARALGQFGDPAAVSHLIKLLSDRNNSHKGERVCNVAADALLAIGTSEALNAVHMWKQRK